MVRRCRLFSNVREKIDGNLNSPWRKAMRHGEKQCENFSKSRRLRNLLVRQYLKKSALLIEEYWIYKMTPSP
jgi:uncharacterized protein YutE (UPF0331/DUF86 family)